MEIRVGAHIRAFGVGIGGLTVGDAAQRLAVLHQYVVVGIDEIENRKSVNSKSSNSKYYDLQGRQIDNRQSVNRILPRGLYIKDGKLIIQ